jgi:S1-C subfamily serine protease
MNIRWHVVIGVVGSVLCAVFATQPGWAANWRLMGNTDHSLDKVYIDADSIEISDGVRIVRVMTVYPTPRLNNQKITIDSHIQLTAVDCQTKLGIGIQTTVFLNGKEVGSRPAVADWRKKLVPLSNEPFQQHLFQEVCSLPVVNGKAPSTASPVLPKPAPPRPKFSTGTGFFVNSEGFLLTNAHVVKGCKNISVIPMNALGGSATLVEMDNKNDLALLSTQFSSAHPVQFRPPSNPVKLGESVGVVGFPLIGILSSEPKATFGQINSVAGLGDDYARLQISAPIQSGNSGSPVFDEHGNVIAIAVSQLMTTFSSVPLPQNVNFAIRGELAQIFLQAHGVGFKAADHKKILRTDEIAATGQQSIALVVCNFE